MLNHSRNEQLAWAQWWAWPWLNAHTDWRERVGAGISPALYRGQHQLINASLGIEPCLARLPSTALLRLVQASLSQRNLMLELVDCVCRSTGAALLSEEQQVWCQRLAKALPPDLRRNNTEDPLQYLRDWVEPAVWQRLRLGFPYQRVMSIEQQPVPVDNHGHLSTFWQAVIWRGTSVPGNAALPEPVENSNDVVSAQNQFA